jgi:hypothetical protein
VGEIPYLIFQMSQVPFTRKHGSLAAVTALDQDLVSGSGDDPVEQIKQLASRGGNWQWAGFRHATSAVVQLRVQ